MSVSMFSKKGFPRGVTMTTNSNRPATAVLSGVFSHVGPLWDEFRVRHALWLERLPADEPVYALTEPVISRLGRAGSRHAAILDAAAAGAERDLLGVCRQHFCVGFWNGRPITYAALTPRLALPADEVLRSVLSPRQITALRQALRMADATARRLDGRAGWLLTEPSFLAERDALRRRWQELPAHERPAFPLGRTVRLPELPPEAVPVAETVVSFAHDVGAFLDRWELMSLATWDLPEPQGPLFPVCLPADSPALPRQGVHLYVPASHRLDGEDLVRQVRDLQRSAAAELGLEPEFAGLHHAELYARILKLVHLERTVTLRYGRARPPRGFVGHVVGALADSLGISTDHVRKLRKAVSACRRGERKRVPMLATPSRDCRPIT
jgi:hypothetical protein